MLTRKSLSSIHSPTRVFALLALVFSSLGATPAYAANLIVTSYANNGPGTLRSAIAAAAAVGPNDTITFDPSLSGATIYLASELTITKDLTIDGSALASKITISGDSDGNGTGDVRVFSTSGPYFIQLDSLVITKGNGSGGIGGAINNSAYLFIYNSTITGNSTLVSGGAIATNNELSLGNTTLSGNSARLNGGGIYNNGGLVYVRGNSTLSGNTAGDGGGIFNNGSEVLVTASTVSGNSALVGGGIYNDNGTLSVTISTLSGNWTTSSVGGGGIYILDGTVSVKASTISGNTTTSHFFASGGGIENGGTLTVADSTLFNNSSSGHGGAIANFGTLTVTNSTIASNATNANGGGIYNGLLGYAWVLNTSIVFNGADADADITGGQAGGVSNSQNGIFNVANSLIAGNSVGGVPIYDDCDGAIYAAGGNLIGALSTATSGSCTIEGSIFSVGYALLNDLSRLGNLQNNGGPTKTVALLSGSNAIDGGDAIFGCSDINGDPLPVDQRGVGRAGANCDVGAYEYAPATDPDGDSVANVADNCTLVANPTQLDADQDGYGNICDGDLNNTNLTTAQDSVILRNQLNQPASANPTAAAADLNGSGLVTAQDNVILRNQLNTAPGPSGLACAGTIPCP